ncbi:MAG: CHAT domain-containing tetratricopeptide repeat protein [Saprospiraceae bacterium]
MLKLFKLSLFTFLLAFKLNAQENGGIPDTAQAHLLLENAATFQEQGQTDQAILFADSATIIFSSQLGSDHYRVADAKEIYSKCLYAKGSYDKAMEVAQEALRIRKKALGEDHVKTGAIYHNIGIIFDAIGDNQTGLKNKFIALDIYRKYYKETHPDILRSYLGIGASYIEIGARDSAQIWLEEGLNMAKEYFGDRKDNILAQYYMNLGILYEGLSYFEKGRDFKLAAMEMKKTLFGEDHPETAIAYLNVGSSYYLLGNLDASIELMQKALSIYQKAYGDDHPVLANFYNNLGAAYNESKEFDKAIVFLDRSLQILLQNFGEEHPQIARAYNNLAVSYEELGKHEHSLEYYDKAVQLYGKLMGENDPTTVETRLNMCVPLQSTYQFERAIAIYKQSIPVLKNALGPDHFYLAYPYNGLGNALSSMKQYEDAIMAFDTALAIKQSVLGKDHYEVALSLTNFGNAFASNGQFEQALEQYDKGLHIIESKKGSIPAETYYYLKRLLLEGKGAIYLKMYQSDHSATTLNISKKNYDEAIEAAKQQKFATYSLGADLVLGSSLKSLAGGAIMAHFQHESDKYKCFDFTELAKSFQLLEALQNEKALHLAGVPDELLNEEKSLKTRIGFLEKLTTKPEEYGVSDSLVIVYKKELLLTKEKFEKFIRNLEASHEKYFESKYSLPFIPVKGVQDSLLTTNQTLLEFFTGDSSIFVFILKKDDYQIHEIKLDFPLQDWVEQYQRGLYGYFGAPAKEQTDALFGTTLSDYLTAAQNLYKKLVAPIEPLLTEEVIVIPDGALNAIPFEALLSAPPTQEDNFSTYPFLIQKHQFSYCYSATLLREMKTKKHKKEPTEPCLALAPFYEGTYAVLENKFGSFYDSLFAVLHLPVDSSLALRKEFSTLPNSGQEVFAAHKIWKGKYFLNKDATVAQFTALAPNYRILHLSTHGSADARAGDYSYLAFAPDSTGNGLLYVRDLYNLQLNADLVTLSACETAAGEMQRGEGIISLARAFAYAGAKSIVTTLWVVNDAASKDLMEAFYTKLHQPGTRKDKALHDAKMAMINGQDDFRKHPFFWAAFVPVGDMEALR